MTANEHTPFSGAELKAKRHKEKWRRRYQVAIIFVMMGLAVGLNVWYTNYVDHKNREDWCELIIASDNLYRTAPTTRPEVAEIAELMSKRRHSLGCD